MGLDLVRFAFDWHYRALKRFRFAKGDTRLLLDFDFAPGEIVVEGGCLEGRFTRGIALRGRPTVIGYEPIPEYAERAREATADLSNVEVRTAGLSDRTGEAAIVLLGEGTSLHRREDAPTVAIRLERAADVLSGLGSETALLALNVEGEEYPILEDLVRTGTIGTVRTLLVQFHRIAPDSESRYARLAAELGRTHALAWRYPFVWERWDRRG